jgi:hypothetical protein
MLIEELIEKAFSDGYEYALEEQREFTSIRALKKQGKMNINMISKFQKKYPSTPTSDAELIKQVYDFARKNGFGDYKFRAMHVPKAGRKLAKNNPDAIDKMVKSFKNHAQKKGIREDLNRF